MKKILAFLMMTSAAWAGDWSSYHNDRFGIDVDTPPGFVNDIPAPENGDGLTFHSEDKAATLLVWGGNILSDFKSESHDAVQSEKDDGWLISYQSSSEKQPKMN